MDSIASDERSNLYCPIGVFPSIAVHPKAFRFGLRLFLWTFLRRLVVNLVRSLSLALKQTRVA